MAPGPPPGGGGQGALWAGTTATNSFDDLVGSPSLPLALVPIVVSLVAAVVATLFGDQIAVTGISWFVAGPVAILLLALYVRHDIGQRARPGYSQPPWAKMLNLTAMGMILLAVGVTAYHIADWAGQQPW
jgi:hypothetical protein